MEPSTQREENKLHKSVASRTEQHSESRSMSQKAVKLKGRDNQEE